MSCIVMRYVSMSHSYWSRAIIHHLIFVCIYSCCTLQNISLEALVVSQVGVNVVYVLSRAYEPPEGRKERPTPHYSVERHLNLNGRDTSLIWTYSQAGRKCCFRSQHATLQAPRSRYTARIRRWR